MIIHILRIVVGICFLLAAVVTMPMGVGFASMLSVPVAAVLAGIGGLCLYPYIIEPIANRLSGFYFGGKAADLPEQYSRVHGMLVRREYDQAVAELNRLLTEKPERVEARCLLMRTYHERLNRSQDATDLATAELKQRKLGAEHEKVVMLAVDILLENQQPREAQAVLASAIPKIADSAASANLRQRLESLGA